MGFTRNWVAKRGGGGGSHLKILLRGFQKNTHCPVEFAILISNVS